MGELKIYKSSILEELVPQIFQMTASSNSNSIIINKVIVTGYFPGNLKKEFTITI